MYSDFPPENNCATGGPLLLPSVRDGHFSHTFSPYALCPCPVVGGKRVVERLGRSLLSGLLSLSLTSEEFLSVGVVGELLAGRPEQLATEKNGAPSSREKGQPVAGSSKVLF